MALELDRDTVAWTYHALNPDDTRADLAKWSATLEKAYGPGVASALQAEGLPADRAHTNWAVALAAVSNGSSASAQLRAACRYLKGLGGAATAAGTIDTLPGAGEVIAAMRRRGAAADTPPIADGRYAGGNHEVAIDLRVDLVQCGVISGDLHRVHAGARHYVASFRTSPGVRAAASAGEWPVIAQDEFGRRVTGTLYLVAQADPPSSLGGRVVFEGGLEGLPARRAIPFVAEYASASFRTLGLEIEVEAGVAPLSAFTRDGRTHTAESALAAAGFETYATGIEDVVPRSEFGWEMAQLHTLMADMAQASLRQRSWELHLLLLSHSDRPGLLGVMFDSSDALQRQGCAVFAETIRRFAGPDADRKLLQTTVHELGHALNLAHRFERTVGRADSTSFMNYDWRYRGGSRSDEYWNRFAFNFDDDEIEFLRHAPLPPVIPGGAPFHSVAYWADGNGGYSPYVPEAPLDDWQLDLAAPASGPLFGFADPVFLTIGLTNLTGRSVTVPKFILDPKAGFIEIVIRRVNAGAFGPGGSDALAFVPAMQRCFEWDAADAVALAHGDRITDNVNLTFGSSGFAFAEPGTYDVTALLVLFDQQRQRELVARSPTLRIRIASPKTTDEERDAMQFFTDDVGLYLALGGSPALSGARDRLESIVERRRGQTKDPLVAHVRRAMAIEQSRGYVRYRDGKFIAEGPHLERAVALIETLGTTTGAFDEATERSTRVLADRWRAGVRGATPSHGPVAPAVVKGKRPRKTT